MKLIAVITREENLARVPDLARDIGVETWWWGSRDSLSPGAIFLLAPAEKGQPLLDALHGLLGPEGRIIVFPPPEVVLPLEQPAEEEEMSPPVKGLRSGMTREELYEDVEKGARLDSTFLLLVVLSTFVAAIGLIKDNMAVIIGAMVIAPLLGPNLALALSSALGDNRLMWQSLKSNLTGIGLAFLLSVAIGALWPQTINSFEIISRTDVGLDSIALALSSGAAAVLSLTTGLSSVLVGVMVAVALLPPAVTAGLLLGSVQIPAALGAGLLLAVNIVCINLAAKIVFQAKGIKPRSVIDLERARQSTTTYLLFWVVSLAILTLVIIVSH